MISGGAPGTGGSSIRCGRGSRGSGGSVGGSCCGGSCDGGSLGGGISGSGGDLSGLGGSGLGGGSGETQAHVIRVCGARPSRPPCQAPCARGEAASRWMA